MRTPSACSDTFYSFCPVCVRFVVRFSAIKRNWSAFVAQVFRFDGLALLCFRNASMLSAPCVAVVIPLRIRSSAVTIVAVLNNVK